MNYPRMLRIMISILATCALLASIAAAVVSWQFIRSAKEVTGTIVANQTKLDDNGKTLHQPTFDFSVEGQNYSVAATSFVSPSPGAVGNQVPVIYDPRNPSSARINSFHYNWALSTVLFVVAIILGTIHFGISWFRNRFHHATPNAA